MLICGFLLHAGAGAQPVLNKACGFQNGSFVQLYVDVNPTVSEGNAGANQTWDFSALSDDLQTTDYTGISVDITPYANDFQQANVATLNYDFNSIDIYSYFTNDDSYYTTWGYEAYGSKRIYSNPRDILRYPFSFGDSFSDTYYASLLVGYNSGSVEVTADGYGTLILSTGIFPNCLRVREVRMDTMADSPTPTYTNDTSYKFFVVNYPEPLCQVVHHHASDGFSFDEIYWQNISPVAVAALNSITSLNLLPNPTAEMLRVSAPFTGDSYSISVYDAAGRLMMKKESLLSVEVTVEVAAWPDGLYLLLVESDGRKASAPFLVQR